MSSFVSLNIIPGTGSLTEPECGFSAGPASWPASNWICLPPPFHGCWGTEFMSSVLEQQAVNPVNHLLCPRVPVSYIVCGQFEIKFQLLLVAPCLKHWAHTDIFPYPMYFIQAGWKTDMPAELCCHLCLLAALGVVSRCPHMPGLPHILLRHSPKWSDHCATIPSHEGKHIFV